MGFREERSALKRSMKQEKESLVETAVRYAWGEHDPEEDEREKENKRKKKINEEEKEDRSSPERKEDGEDEDDEEVWGRDRGWWARRNHEEPRLTKYVGWNCRELRQRKNITRLTESVPYVEESTLVLSRWLSFFSFLLCFFLFRALAFIGSRLRVPSTISYHG